MPYLKNPKNFLEYFNKNFILTSGGNEKVNKMSCFPYLPYLPEEESDHESNPAYLL